MSKRKLLLADDSVTIQKVVNLTFADEGIEVIAVGDGNQAMEKFVESVPDLVMVDVNMPGFDGYKICEIIKQDDETRHIPVILLVGSFEPFDEEEARRVGADDYLTKPFQSIRQLVSKVTGLLDSAGGKTALNAETQIAATDETAAASSDNNYEVFPQSDSAERDETANYGGASIDEEAAQTNQIGSLPVDETQKFSSAFSGGDFPQTASNQSNTNVFADSADYQTEEKDWAKTQPLSAEELREANSNYGDDSAETVSDDEKVYDFADEDNSAPESAVADSETSAQNSSGDDESSEQNRTKGLIIDSDEENENKTANGASAAVELDEMDLLELPFSDDDEFYDFEDETIDEVRLTENDEAVEVAPTEQAETENQYTIQTTETETQHPNRKAESESPAEISVQTSERQQNDAPEMTADTSENHTLSDFPPELIDAIAAKVVEKLSDRVIREIAWEVVPQMTDLIIQKMARDKLNK